MKIHGEIKQDRGTETVIVTLATDGLDSITETISKMDTSSIFATNFTGYIELTASVVEKIENTRGIKLLRFSEKTIEKPRFIYSPINGENMDLNIDSLLDIGSAIEMQLDLDYVQAEYNGDDQWTIEDEDGEAIGHVQEV